MPQSWTDIRDSAAKFQHRWADASRENAESQSFWAEFLGIFGVDRKKVAIYEKQVEIKRGQRTVKNGRIDLFWPGMLLVEMKSAGHDLDRAFAQAAEYFDALPAKDLPRYILVSDFKRFRLFDVHNGIDHPEFTLAQLRDRIRLFGFIAGYQVQAITPQDPVNIHAAERMGALHDALKASGYTGHNLEVLLVRLLFCLFADDTGIFTPAQSFREFIDTQSDDGAALGGKLTELFDVLNTPEDQRQASQQQDFQAFPYVNGKLFAEPLRPPAFNRKMRDVLLDACALDWSTISPAIFGALFQSIMDDKARRNLGAHYTSEENILKLIKPLFLDALWAEFERVKNNRNRLFEFQKRLRTLTFFDPACGCGNFLVITYRELRKLELGVLRVAYAHGQQMLNVHTFISVDVDQFYGIEIEEFPAQIAQVALWLVDHQMNSIVSNEFGAYFARIPLKSSATIVHGNALRIDWASVLPAQQCSYVLGNPPFVGAKFMGDAQRADAQAVFAGVANGGLLDFVAAWYVKAARYMQGTAAALPAPSPPPAQGRSALTPSPLVGEGGGGITPSPLAGEGWGGVTQPPRCAFVSTNSITQGEQVGVLWGWLLAQGVRIHFAHRTFRWSNEASGKAAVHCVIIGFGLGDVPNKTLFEYDSIAGEPHAVAVSNINPYLFDGPDVLVTSRMKPLDAVAEIANGSIPADGGSLILTADERTTLLESEPLAAAWLRPYLGAEGFIHNEVRYCLWLVDCPPQVLRQMPLVRARISAVQRMRAASAKAATRAKAATPALFTEDRQPRQGTYIAVPRTSSENRAYLPIGYLSADVIAANDLQIIPGGSLIAFAVISSTMHRAWTDVTSGRLDVKLQ